MNDDKDAAMTVIFFVQQSALKRDLPTFKRSLPIGVQADGALVELGQGDAAPPQVCILILEDTAAPDPQWRHPVEKGSVAVLHRPDNQDQRAWLQQNQVTVSGDVLSHVGGNVPYRLVKTLLGAADQRTRGETSAQIVQHFGTEWCLVQLQTLAALLALKGAGRTGYDNEIASVYTAAASRLGYPPAFEIRDGVDAGAPKTWRQISVEDVEAAADALLP